MGDVVQSEVQLTKDVVVSERSWYTRLATFGW